MHTYVYVCTSTYGGATLPLLFSLKFRLPVGNVTCKKRKRQQNVLKTNDNDYVRLLQTKTFQKKVCKKNRKEILMDIVSKDDHS
jgi:hypothetical protein